MEVTLGVHAKVSLTGEKKNEPVAFQRSWKVGKSKQNHTGQRGGAGEGWLSWRIPVLLRGSSRYLQPCCHPELQRREQPLWPSYRSCNCPQAAGCHPSTAARTHPSDLGHFLEGGENHNLHLHQNTQVHTQKSSLGQHCNELILAEGKRDKLHTALQ